MTNLPFLGIFFLRNLSLTFLSLLVLGTVSRGWLINCHSKRTLALYSINSNLDGKRCPFSPAALDGVLQPLVRVQQDGRGGGQVHVARQRHIQHGQLLFGTELIRGKCY